MAIGSQLRSRALVRACALLSLIAFMGAAMGCGAAAARSCRPTKHTCRAAQRHGRLAAREHERRTAPGATRPRRARTFYVASGGRDGNAGTGPRHAWRTVTRVDRAILRPGDTVLFEGGATFTDATLMPGDGVDASGTRRRRIRFGSYGHGVARLTRGVWLGTDARHPRGPRWLTFRHLALGPVQGFQGTGDHITLTGLRIGPLVPPVAHQETGIQTDGSHWIITANLIDRTGGSGMLLGASAETPRDPAGGRFYLVSGNTVAHTGLDAAIGYPTHGIYLKAANARIVHNRILGFRDDGVSARYRDAVVSDNRITDGQIGIAWFQYDSTPGRSRFVDNVISDVTSAGIFVCGTTESCLRPIESFDIAGNQLRGIRGVRMNLQPTAGTYLLRRR